MHEFTHVFFLHMLMYKQKFASYISSCPHLWSLQDGAPLLGSSARCFSSGELLLKAIMTASSPRKGTTSSSMGASTTSVPRGRDAMAMKLFIGP
jgi:hypothetical protein